MHKIPNEHWNNDISAGVLVVASTARNQDGMPMPMSMPRAYEKGKPCISETDETTHQFSRLGCEELTFRVVSSGDGGVLCYAEGRCCSCVGYSCSRSVARFVSREEASCCASPQRPSLASAVLAARGIYRQANGIRTVSVCD